MTSISRLLPRRRILVQSDGRVAPARVSAMPPRAAMVGKRHDACCHFWARIFLWATRHNG